MITALTYTFVKRFGMARTAAVTLPLVVWSLGPTVSMAAEPLHYSATNLWKFPIGWGSQSSPALGHDGVIYVGTWSGDLLAISPEGAEQWRFKTGFEIAASPAIGADDTIYVGCRDRKIYAVDKHGRKRWAFKTGGWVDASAAIGEDGTVYFGSWDRKFYALSQDGLKQWEFVTESPVVSSAAIDAGGVIYFGSNDGNFYALNPDGSMRWQYPVTGAIISSPAIGAAGELYFTSVDGCFHAVNPDGTRRWELRTSGTTGSSPVLGTDGTIFVSVNQTHCAISPDGQFEWRRGFWHPQPGLFGESAAAVLANGHVVFTGGDGYVMTVPGDNGGGDWIWNYYLHGPSRSSPVVADNGTIYAMGKGTELSALKREIPLAASPWPMFRANPQHTGRISGRPSRTGP